MPAKPTALANPRRPAPAADAQSSLASRPLRWARGLFKRTKASETDDAPEAAREAKPVLQQMREELGARLLVSDPSTQAVRHLYLVHKELGKDGWASVEALPRPVTGRAQVEAEIMQGEDPSPLMAMIVEQLTALNAAADQAAAREAAERFEREWAVTDIPEVSEATHEEYEVMERSWIGTIPSGLAPFEPHPAA